MSIAIRTRLASIELALRGEVRLLETSLPDDPQYITFADLRNLIKSQQNRIKELTIIADYIKQTHEEMLDA